MIIFNFIPLIFKDIPYFKQVVIMATTCDDCGYRTNEVKPGGGIENQGIKIAVHVSSPEDLNRDILKVIHFHKNCIHIPNSYYNILLLFSVGNM